MVALIYHVLIVISCKLTLRLFKHVFFLHFHVEKLPHLCLHLLLHLQSELFPLLQLVQPRFLLGLVMLIS
jgi:hypothetical protein